MAGNFCIHFFNIVKAHICEMYKCDLISLRMFLKQSTFIEH